MAMDNILAIIGAIVVVVLLIGFGIFGIMQSKNQAEDLTNENVQGAAEASKGAFENLAGDFAKD